jgi:phosphoribosylaminoimidazolecarboxamide formyltransferase/IMP cyclohydrolase
MKYIKTALISVYDKEGLIPFAEGLVKLGINIISTGKTAGVLRKARVSCIDASEITSFPEILDGRVKTLHPKIHGGILADRDKDEHMKLLEEYQIPRIDMVVVNLYPFEETLRSGKSKEEIIEMIDIGGPAMLRAAAKNHSGVTAICDVNDYKEVLSELKVNNGSIKGELRLKLAAKAFERTSSYDLVVASFMSAQTNGASSGNDLPQIQRFEFKKKYNLRYGENPHQKAAIYSDTSSGEEGFVNSEVLGGKELSFNNFLDMEAAYSTVCSFKEPASCVVKHVSPCGAALDENPQNAFKKAFRCDSLSAFGGIVGFNRGVDDITAKAVSDAGFLECIVAPAFSKGALDILRKKKNLRLVKMKAKISSGHFDFKRISGGVLIQETDQKDAAREDLKFVTKKKPTPKQIDDLLFAFKICRFAKSNTIVLAKNSETLGIGTGQPSRVDSAIHAFRKAGRRANGAVMASDGFFPKPDSILEAKKHGIKAVIQPGGSIQDKAVIEACDKAGISMVMTGIRHFAH